MPGYLFIAPNSNTLTGIEPHLEKPCVFWDVLPEKLNPDELNAFGAIIIYAENCTGGRKYQDFYGFEIVKSLRFLKVLCPIIICSFIQKENYLNSPNTEYHILVTPGHYYLPQTFSLQEMKRCLKIVRPLTPDQLEDILYYCYDIHGIAKEILHHFKDRVLQPGYEVYLHNSFSRLANLVFAEHKNRLEEIKLKLLENIGNNQINKAELINHARDEIMRLLPPEDNKSPGWFGNPPWVALFADDEEHIRGLVSEKLQERGITCLTAKNGKQVFRMLSKDIEGKLTLSSGKKLPANSITILICDMRFIKTGNDWDYWQGYEIVRHIHTGMHNHLGFIMLSSKSGFIKKGINQRHNIRLFWEYKDDILDNNAGHRFNDFTRLVYREGQRAYEAILYKPSGQYWEKSFRNIQYPLADFYHVHRHSDNYESNEEIISKTAREFITVAENIKNFGENIEKGRFQLTAKIEKGPDDKNTMDKFFNKLIGRRVVFALWLMGWQKPEITSVLMEGKIIKDYADPNLYTVFLAMSSAIGDDIPMHLLPEEISWLEQEMHISVNKSALQFFKAVERIVENFKARLMHYSGDDFTEEPTRIANIEETKQLLNACFTYCRHFIELKPQFIADLQLLMENALFEKYCLDTGIDKLLKHA